MLNCNKVKPLWTNTPQSSVLGSSHTISVSNLPGFEVLDDCSQIYTVNVTPKSAKPQSAQNPPPINLPNQKLTWRQYFQILNSRGEHILSAAEVKPDRLATMEFCIYVLTKKGDILFTIARRNELWCAGLGTGRRRGGRRDWKAYRKSDEYLRCQTKFIHSGDADEDGRLSQIHVCLPGGSFLGHIFAYLETGRWLNKRCEGYIIHDIEYLPILNIERSRSNNNDLKPPHHLREIPSVGSSMASSLAEPSKVQDGENSKKGVKEVEKSNVNPTNKSNYDLVVEGKKVGAVQFGVNLEEILQTAAKSTDCAGVSFFAEFEEEEKALVLSFLLHQQRTKDTASKLVKILCSGFTLSFLFLFLLIVITVVVLWNFGLLNRNS